MGPGHQRGEKEEGAAVAVARAVLGQPRKENRRRGKEKASGPAEGVGPSGQNEEERGRIEFPFSFYFLEF